MYTGFIYSLASPRLKAVQLNLCSLSASPLLICFMPQKGGLTASVNLGWLVQGLVEAAVMRDDYDSALVAITVWLRYSAARHLTWNLNYNVKPREISAAQV